MGSSKQPGLTAVVLAAGLGTRFLPITRRIPKPAIPFLNRPILHWVLDALRTSGVERVLMNLHHLPEGVRDCALAHGGNPEVAFSFEPEILGTAGLYNPLRGALPDVFLACNADLRIGSDLSFLLRDIQSHPEALATLAVLPRPEGKAYTGLQVDPEGRLRAFGRGAWMFTGIYAARASLLDHLAAGGFLELVKDLLAPLLPGGRIRAIPLPGTWADLGTPAEYLGETARGLEALASGHGGMVPERSRMEMRNGHPVLLHETAWLDPQAEVLGPLVLGPGASAGSGSRAGPGVLLPHSHLGEGEHLCGAILGPDGAVVTSRSQPAAGPVGGPQI